MAARGPQRTHIHNLVAQLVSESEYQHSDDSRFRGADLAKIARAIGVSRQRVQQVYARSISEYISPHAEKSDCIVDGDVIRPPDSISPLAAKFWLSGAILNILAPARIERLIHIVSRIGFSWIDYRWQKDSVTLDFGVEIAHLLLNRQLSLRVEDPSFRDAIVAGVYTPELTRRVHILREGQKSSWYTIHWCRLRDDDHYRNAMSLTGARWSKKRRCVLVPPDSTDEVVDFAQMHDFTISSDAQAAIEAERARPLERMRIKVKVRPVPTRTTPGDVDPSLIDDDIQTDKGSGE